MTTSAKKKLDPLNITNDEPVVQVSKRIFKRIQYLHNKSRTVEELLEYAELIDLLFHTHDEEGGR